MASVASLSLVIIAAWYVVSRRGAVRVIAAVLAAAGLVGFVVVVVASESVRILVVSLLLAAVSIARLGTRCAGPVRPPGRPRPPRLDIRCC